jgi:hypothetical protein
MSTFKGTVNIVPNILLLQNLCLLVRYICSVTNTIVFLCKVSELREDSSSAVELGKAVSHEVAHSNSEKKNKEKGNISCLGILVFCSIWPLSRVYNSEKVKLLLKKTTLLTTSL